MITTKKAICVTLIAAVILGGCGKTSDSDTSMFETVESDLWYNRYVVYDKETRVMYMFTHEGGLHPLYNTDGSLKLYK